MSEKKFHVANFGCRVSQAEGGAIDAELSANAPDTARAESPFHADVLIINSCTVTEEADRDVRRLIRRVARRNPETEIIVTGCYAQRRPEELAAMPQVRYVVGNSHKGTVGSLARGRFEGSLNDGRVAGSSNDGRVTGSSNDGRAAGSSNDGRAEIFCSEIFIDRRLSKPPYQGSGGRTRATVKVQDGCNATCAFCIIPTVRGPGRSLAPESVIGQVRDLVERGFHEVVFSGIHLGSYGRDIGPRCSLTELVSRTLVGVPALERLRLSSIEPLEVTAEIIDRVANDSRVATHLHVPMQSGSSRVLEAMRRPYRAPEYAALVERIRRAAPDAAIGADVMVGFPGETDDDFLMTYRLIEKSSLTYLHVFPYSPRPGTAAAAFPNPVPEHVARFRGQQLRELIGRKNDAFRRRFVGRDIWVLVLDEEAKSGWRSAISDNFIKVRVPQALAANRWYRMPISGVQGQGLEARDYMMTTAAEVV